MPRPLLQAASAAVAREVQAELAAQLAVRDRDLAELRARCRTLEASVAQATAQAAAAAAAAAATTGASSASAPLPHASPATPDGPLSDAVWRAACGHLRAECAALRARLAQTQHSPALALLARRPLPAPALTMPASPGIDASEAINSARGSEALSTAARALHSAGLVRVQRRIPLLRRGGDGVPASLPAAAEHVLGEACAAAAAVLSLRYAGNGVHEEQLRVQALAAQYY